MICAHPTLNPSRQPTNTTTTTVDPFATNKLSRLLLRVLRVPQQRSTKINKQIPTQTLGRSLHRRLPAWNVNRCWSESASSAPVKPTPWPRQLDFLLKMLHSYKSLLTGNKQPMMRMPLVVQREKLCPTCRQKMLDWLQPTLRNAWRQQD